MKRGTNARHDTIPHMSQKQFLTIELGLWDTHPWLVYGFPKWIKILTWPKWKATDAAIRWDVKRAVRELLSDKDDEC